MSQSEPKMPIMTVSSESPVQVAGVTAVFLSVTNVGVRSIMVDEYHALNGSQASGGPLTVYSAIEKAGSADKLTASLDHLPSTANELFSPITTFIPGTRANQRSLGWAALAFPIVPLEAGALLVSRSVAAVAMPDRLRLMDGSFFDDPGARIAWIGKGESRSGYVFFESRNYSAIEVSARDPKTFQRQTIKCTWASKGVERCADVESPSINDGRFTPTSP